MAHAVGKAALLVLTRQLVVELAPAIRGMRWRRDRCCRRPTPTRGTPQRRRRTLLKRWGEPEDVALAVKYLLEADYVTGDVVTVDGGERYGARTAGAPN